MNNSHFCEFRQRTSIYSAQLLEVKGDISLDSAQVSSAGMGGGMGYPQMGMGMPFVQPSAPAFGAGAVNISYSPYPPAQPFPSVPSYPVS